MPTEENPSSVPQHEAERRAEQMLREYTRAELSALRRSVENNHRIDATAGYVPYLEKLLREIEDSDQSQRVLKSATRAIQTNLNQLQQTLESMPDAQSPAYRRLEKLYSERRARFAELLADIDENYENADLRNVRLAINNTQEAMRHMTVDRAILWVERMMAKIDRNNWQSQGLQETYGQFTIACKQALQAKLAQEKTGAMNNPRAAHDYARHCIRLAKLFTDRGGSIDNNLTDIDFAVDLAREAMGFQDLALRYAERSGKRKNPLRQYLESHTPNVLHQLQERLPAQTFEQSQVQEMIRTLQAPPVRTVQELAQHYAILRQLETFLAGGGPPNIEQEINRRFNPYIESSYARFETFLNGTLNGAASLQQINAIVGPLQPDQVEAWRLLSDIQGYGWDLSDKTWQYIGVGAKIAAMIAAGIAVGITTGGLGIVGVALAGGATMTAANAAINQQGFDTAGEALKIYSKDFAVNAATMGSARYLAAGRAAYQLSRAGTLSDVGGVRELFRLATTRGGMRVVNSFDEAFGIGSRLTGATLEGTADTLIGTTLDTAVRGGSFLDNLRNNAMFFGLGYAEFAGSAMRNVGRWLRNKPPGEIHALAQLTNSIQLERALLERFCRSAEIDPRSLMDAQNPREFLQGIDPNVADRIATSVEKLRTQRETLRATFDVMSAPQPEPLSSASASQQAVSEIPKKPLSPDVESSPDIVLPQALRNIHEPIDPFVLERFQDRGFFNALPARIRNDPAVLADYISNSSKFEELMSGDITGLFGEEITIQETQHGSGTTRRAERGLTINLDFLIQRGIDPSKVLMYRVTQPSSTPKPEYYWTTDFFETQRGLTREISSEHRATAVTLVADMATIAGRGGLIRDINDDAGLAVRQISIEPFDHNQSLAIIR